MKKIFILLAALFIFFIAFCANAQNTIRFGVIYFYPPFVFSSKSGYIHGFDIDVAKAVCQQLSAQCIFKPMSLPQAFISLNQNKVDVIIGAISVTPSRREYFEFSRPYLKSTMSFVTLSTSQIDPNMLQNRRVGVIKDSTFATYLTKKYSGKIYMRTYDTNEQLAASLSNKEVDIILLDTPAANFWVGYSTGLFKTAGNPELLDFDEGYGIAAKKGNTNLINKISQALNTILKNGTFEKIRQSYFSQQPPLQEPRA